MIFTKAVYRFAVTRKPEMSGTSISSSIRPRHKFVT